MFKFEKIDKHADLVSRMGKTLGVDVVDEALHGELYESELRSRVFRCMACTEIEACEHFLADHVDGAAAAPDYCRNADMFGRITGA